MCGVKSNTQRDAVVPGVKDNKEIPDSLGEDTIKECGNCCTISWGSDNEHTSGASDFSVGVTKNEHSWENEKLLYSKNFRGRNLSQNRENRRFLGENFRGSMIEWDACAHVHLHARL